MLIGAEGKNIKTTAIFGNGNIRMTAGVLNEEMYLGLKHEEEAREIGIREDSDYKTCTQLIENSDILIVFRNEKSLDVLIGKLEELKLLNAHDSERV